MEQGRVTVNLPTLPKLSKWEDYLQWRSQVKLGLQGRGLWRYVDLGGGLQTPRATVQLAEGTTGSIATSIKVKEGAETPDTAALARSLLILAVDAELLMDLDEEETASAAWERLAERFKEWSQTSQISLRQQWNRLSQNQGEGLQAYMVRMEKLRGRLKQHNFLIGEREAAEKLLALQPEWTSATEALLVQHQLSDLTVQTVRSHFTSVEQVRLLRASDTAPVDHLAMSAASPSTSQGARKGGRGQPQSQQQAKKKSAVQRGAPPQRTQPTRPPVGPAEPEAGGVGPRPATAASPPPTDLRTLRQDRAQHVRMLGPVPSAATGVPREAGTRSTGSVRTAWSRGGRLRLPCLLGRGCGCCRCQGPQLVSGQWSYTAHVI